LQSAKTSNKSLVSIIAASSAGTLIEWYDFFIFGSLATIISTEFFPKENPAVAFLATLATFSAGLVVRPFGALFFGRLGDIVGRKYTFMITLILMGGSTIAMGLVPTYESIGLFSPLIVLLLRLMQGLAIGGEYGGAATYVAEHSPKNQRGFWTSWIQASTGLAFILSITVILITKNAMDNNSWESWGWRVPFVVSIFMVAISVYMRKQMAESPLFAKAKAAGKTSLNPLKESFGNKENLKIVLLAFLGLTVGGGTIGWIGVYAQSFLIRTMSLEYGQANQVIVLGILIGIPFFFFFGWLSDKIGRKYLMMFGILAGMVCFRPIFQSMYDVTNLKNKIENTTSATVNTKMEYLSRSNSGLINTILHFYTDGTVCKEVKRGITQTATRNLETIKTITVTSNDKWKLVFLVFLLELIFTASYAPLAAFIVEMFPLKIRYTSISLPYHFGYGIFGGLAPYFATYLVQKAGEAGRNDYYLAGLNYPISLMSISFIIGLLYIKENNSEHSLRIIPTAAINKIKKWLGIVWIVLGLLAAWYGLFKMAIPKLSTGKQEDIVFGIIVMLIITPVSAAALFFFGKYALQREYDE
jgi:MFS family permease